MHFLKTENKDSVDRSGVRVGGDKHKKYVVQLNPTMLPAYGVNLAEVLQKILFLTVKITFLKMN
jgi:Cu/Ag efflux pump CusA